MDRLSDLVCWDHPFPANDFHFRRSTDHNPVTDSTRTPVVYDGQRHQLTDSNPVSISFSRKNHHGTYGRLFQKNLGRRSKNGLHLHSQRQTFVLPGCRQTIRAPFKQDTEHGKRGIVPLHMPGTTASARSLFYSLGWAEVWGQNLDRKGQKG